MSTKFIRSCSVVALVVAVVAVTGCQTVSDFAGNLTKGFNSGSQPISNGLMKTSDTIAMKQARGGGSVTAIDAPSGAPIEDSCIANLNKPSKEVLDRYSARDSEYFRFDAFVIQGKKSKEKELLAQLKKQGHSGDIAQTAYYSYKSGSVARAEGCLVLKIVFLNVTRKAGEQVTGFVYSKAKSNPKPKGMYTPVEIEPGIFAVIVRNGMGSIQVPESWFEIDSQFRVTSDQTLFPRTGTWTGSKTGSIKKEIDDGNQYRIALFVADDSKSVATLVKPMETQIDVSDVPDAFPDESNAAVVPIATESPLPDDSKKSQSSGVIAPATSAAPVSNLDQASAVQPSSPAIPVVKVTSGDVVAVEPAKVSSTPEPVIIPNCFDAPECFGEEES